MEEYKNISSNSVTINCAEKNALNFIFNSLSSCKKKELINQYLRTKKIKGIKVDEFARELLRYKVEHISLKNQVRCSYCANTSPKMYNTNLKMCVSCKETYITEVKKHGCMVIYKKLMHKFFVVSQLSNNNELVFDIKIYIMEYVFKLYIYTVNFWATQKMKY